MVYSYDIERARKSGASGNEGERLFLKGEIERAKEFRRRYPPRKEEEERELPHGFFRGETERAKEFRRRYPLRKEEERLGFLRDEEERARKVGVPRSEEERLARHRALYNKDVLPPRGTGLVREGIPTAGRRFGVPRSEEQRERQHYAKYGTAELPPRGTGIREIKVGAGNLRVVGMKREGKLFMPIYS